MHRILRIWGLVILIAAGAFSADPPVEPRRPRIGLALSGGAAYGLAHVGVLRWLAEHRIPIDYVAGTSMGGLVGGLYATGHTPAEMEKFLGAINWQGALSTAVPYSEMSFRRKSDERSYPTHLEFGVGLKGIRFPDGLNNGHGVGLVLSRFTAPWEELSSFNELPTPFATVATDLKSSQPVVFDRGPLFEALRATMSLPAFFAPLERGNQLLVDGGLLDNIPVDLVRKAGVDIVIAVALNAPPDEKAYSSLMGVARQSVSVMITANERRSLADADIVIAPDLNGATGTDYRLWQMLDQRGYAAADRKRAVLEKLAVSESQYAAYLEQRRSRRRPEMIRPAFVEVVADGRAGHAPELRRTLANDSDAALAQADIEKELTGIIGDGRFGAARYAFVRRDGADGLRVVADSKAYGPVIARFSTIIDGQPGDGLQFGFGGRVTWLDFTGKGSDLRADFTAGIQNHASLELYHRLGSRKWFVAPGAMYDKSALRAFEGKHELFEASRQEVGGSLDLGYAASSSDEIRLGVSRSHLGYSLNRGTIGIPLPSGTRTQYYLSGEHERQDDGALPTKGSYAYYSLGWVAASPDAPEGGYPLLATELSYAWRLTSKYHVITRAAGGTTASGSSIVPSFQMGGPSRLAALSRGELYGNHFYYGGAYLMRRLSSDSLSLFGRFYAMTSYETGNAWMKGVTPLPRHSGTLGLAGATPVGLVYFGGALGDRGDRKIFFVLGRFF